MANDPKKPEPGELVIDASALASIVTDLPPRGMLGLVGPREGLSEVLAEIRAAQPDAGNRAGISDEMAAELETLTAQIAQIDAFLPAVLKLAELLEESRAVLEDDRYQIISSVASMVDRRSKKESNSDLLAKYEKTRAYRSLIGRRAAKTRADNAAEEAATP